MERASWQAYRGGGRAKPCRTAILVVAALAVVAGCSVPKRFSAQPYVDDPIFTLDLPGATGKVLAVSGNWVDGPGAADAQLIQDWTAVEPYDASMGVGLQLARGVGVEFGGAACDGEGMIFTGFKPVEGNLIAWVMLELSPTTGEGTVQLSVGHDSSTVEVYRASPPPAPVIDPACPAELVAAAGLTPVPEAGPASGGS